MLNYLLVRDLIDNFSPQTDAAVGSPLRTSGSSSKPSGTSNSSGDSSSATLSSPTKSKRGGKESSHTPKKDLATADASGAKGKGKKSSSTHKAKEPSAPPVSMAELEVYHKKFIGPGQGQIAVTFLSQIRNNLSHACGVEVVDDLIAFGYLQVNTSKLDVAVEIFQVCSDILLSSLYSLLSSTFSLQSILSLFSISLKMNGGEVNFFLCDGILDIKSLSRGPNSCALGVGKRVGHERSL